MLPNMLCLRNTFLCENFVQVEQMDILVAIKKFPWLKIYFIGQAWLELFHNVGLANDIKERRKIRIYTSLFLYHMNQGRIQVWILFKACLKASSRSSIFSWYCPYYSFSNKRALHYNRSIQPNFLSPSICMMIIYFVLSSVIPNFFLILL